jgi:hypothetical protein
VQKFDKNSFLLSGIQNAQTEQLEQNCSVCSGCCPLEKKI